MQVIVTGGSRGIGRSIVERLVSDGHEVVFSYRSNSCQAEETISQIKSQAPEARVLAVQADVTRMEDCTSLVEEAEAYFGDRVWALVNNAGVNKDTLVLRMSQEDFELVLDTDLVGPFLMSKAVLPSLMKRKAGRIVNMSSVIGIYGNAGQANYAAAKAGLIGLSKTLAKEFASRNILVNAVCPGMVETEMTDQMPEKARDMALSQIMLKRMAQPEEIASVVSFLLSKDSSYITGQAIEVSGGLVL